jgi:hypothetical protein
VSQNHGHVTVQAYPDFEKPGIKATFESHWNYRDRVLVKMGNEQHIFIISDIRRALDSVESEVATDRARRIEAKRHLFHHLEERCSQ